MERNLWGPPPATIALMRWWRTTWFWQKQTRGCGSPVACCSFVCVITPGGKKTSCEMATKSLLGDYRWRNAKEADFLEWLTTSLPPHQSSIPLLVQSLPLFSRRACLLSCLVLSLPLVSSHLSSPLFLWAGGAVCSVWCRCVPVTPLTLSLQSLCPGLLIKQSDNLPHQGENKMKIVELLAVLSPPYPLVFGIEFTIFSWNMDYMDCNGSNLGPSCWLTQTMGMQREVYSLSYQLMLLTIVA